MFACRDSIDSIAKNENLYLLITSINQRLIDFFQHRSSFLNDLFAVKCVEEFESVKKTIFSLFF